MMDNNNKQNESISSIDLITSSSSVSNDIGNLLLLFSIKTKNNNSHIELIIYFLLKNKTCNI